MGSLHKNPNRLGPEDFQVVNTSMQVLTGQPLPHTLPAHPFRPRVYLSPLSYSLIMNQSSNEQSASVTSVSHSGKLTEPRRGPGNLGSIAGCRDLQPACDEGVWGLSVGPSTRPAGADAVSRYTVLEWS